MSFKHPEPLSGACFYRYHRLTKHTVEKLLASHHHLDWDNQPDPFRRYAGAPTVDLPDPSYICPVSFFQGLASTLAGQEPAGQELAVPAQEGDLGFLSHLLYYSLSISAWKELAGTGHRWSLRVNPSSGDLHPTEAHLLVQSAGDLAAGAYHYLVPEHKLEQRAKGEIAQQLWQALGRRSDCPPVIVCLTSIFWREAWKYRDRAYRYCQHDMGHALAALMLSAGTLGWSCEIAGEFPDRELAAWLGFAGSDEQPSLLLGLRPAPLRASTPENAASPGGAGAPPASHRESEGAAGAGPAFQFTGKPNQLSPEIIRYRSIDDVHASTVLTPGEYRARSGRALPPAGGRLPGITACGAEIEAVYEPAAARSGWNVHRLVRARRSAVDMDGQQEMGLRELTTILVAATRGFLADFQRPCPWKAGGTCGHHLIHLFLYVHRVREARQGIYYFDRVGQRLVPLVFADQREAARYFSCFQDIAADGCFAVSMIADFNTAYELYGDRGYRYVHFEAGVIGQWLYLSSLALGYDSTGIGCFIDDLVNQHLDLPAGFEVVYNFTVGRAVLDPRLTTLPSYSFPDPAASTDA